MGLGFGFNLLPQPDGLFLHALGIRDRLRVRVRVRVRVRGGLCPTTVTRLVKCDRRV